MVVILYFVPEDGDEEQYPNYFECASDKLGDIKKSFPIPGAYHFRFKTAFKNTFVWMDVTNDKDRVPKFQGGAIIAKVSRIQVQQRLPQRETSPSLQQTSSPLTRNSKKATMNGLMQHNSSGDLLGLGSASDLLQPSSNLSTSMPNSRSNPALQTINPPPSSSTQQNSNVMDLDWVNAPARSSATPPPRVGKPITSSIPRAVNTPPIGAMSTGTSKLSAFSTTSKTNTKQGTARLAEQNLSTAAKDFSL